MEIMNMMKRKMESIKNNGNIASRDKTITIFEIKSILNGNYSRFHTGNKFTGEIEVIAIGKIPNKAWWIKK